MVQFRLYPVGGTLAQNTLDCLMGWSRSRTGVTPQLLWGLETTNLKEKVLQRDVRAVCDSEKLSCEGAAGSFCVPLRKTA